MEVPRADGLRDDDPGGAAGADRGELLRAIAQRRLYVRDLRASLERARLAFADQLARGSGGGGAGDEHPDPAPDAAADGDAAPVVRVGGVGAVLVGDADYSPGPVGGADLDPAADLPDAGAGGALRGAAGADEPAHPAKPVIRLSPDLDLLALLREGDG